MWINLHNEWCHVKRINNHTIWGTVIMLFFSFLFPYSTSIVSENFSNSSAQFFYGIIVIAITISNILTHQTLIKENAENYWSGTFDYSLASSDVLCCIINSTCPSDSKPNQIYP